MKKIVMLSIALICMLSFSACTKSGGEGAWDPFFDDMKNASVVKVNYVNAWMADTSLASLFYEGGGIKEVDEPDDDGKMTGRQDYVCQFVDENDNILYHMQYYSDDKNVDSLLVLVYKNPMEDDSEIRYYEVTNEDILDELLSYVGKGKTVLPNGVY